jgi:hypothetical protein
VLTLFGIAVNGATGLVNGRLISPENPIADRVAFVRTQDDVDGLLGRSARGVRTGPVLPPTSPGAPGDLFVVGRCDALYVTTLNAGWLPVERTAGDGYHLLDVRVPRRTAGPVPFAVLGTGRGKVLFSMTAGPRGTVFAIDGRRRAFPATGREVRARVTVDRLGAATFAALRIDGTFVGVATFGQGPRAPLRLSRFARAVTLRAPACDDVARRANLPRSP